MWQRASEGDTGNSCRFSRTVAPADACLRLLAHLRVRWESRTLSYSSIPLGFHSTLLRYRNRYLKTTNDIPCAVFSKFERGNAALRQLLSRPNLSTGGQNADLIACRNASNVEKNATADDGMEDAHRSGYVRESGHSCDAAKRTYKMKTP